MNRFVTAAILAASLAGAGFASDPSSPRAAKTKEPASLGRESDPNHRMNKLLNESEDLGQAREEFHRFWMNNQPSVLNESEDLGQAREEFHRFWMNNQPSVLTYERLSGAIGP